LNRISIVNNLASSLAVTTRTETTQGPTYLLAKRWGLLHDNKVSESDPPILWLQEWGQAQRIPTINSNNKRS